MRASAALVVAVAACGRIGFDGNPVDDAVPTDVAVSDATPSDAALADALDAPPADESLALYMPFEGDKTFLSASEYPTVCSGACPTPVGGRIGQQAASFNSNECVLIGANNLRPTQFTFAVWVRAPIAQTATIFARPFRGDIASTNTLELYVENGTDWRVLVSDQATGTSAPLAEWHHVAATYDGNLLTMYLDGAPETTRMVGGISYSVEDLRVGCDLNTGVEDDFFNGLVDDLRVYTRVLTNDEIAALAN